jgi:aspartate aminotransferase-like enzyme
MGNITRDDVLQATDAVERVMLAAGLDITPGAGLAAASE